MVKNQFRDKNAMWRNDIDTDMILIKYFLDKKTLEQTAKELNCTIGLIRDRIISMGLKPRSIKETRKQVAEILKKNRDPTSKKGNRKNYLELAKKNKRWICERCNKDRTNDNFDLIVHHKDGNIFNNNIDNIEILCQSCHASEHSKRGEFTQW